MPDRTIIGVLMAATAMVAVAAVIPEPRKAAPLPTAGQPAASGAGAEGSAARIEGGASSGRRESGDGGA